MSNPLGKYTKPDGSFIWVELACDESGRLLVSGGDGDTNTSEASLERIAAAVGTIDAPANAAGIAMLARYLANDALPADISGDWCGLSVNERGRLRVSAQPALGDLTVGDITASGQTVVCATERWSNVMVHMVGAGLSGHNCTFEGSIDSTNGIDGNWFAIQAVRSNANTVELVTGVLAATPAYGWELSTNGMSFIRARATAHTAGTATWKFLPAPYATEPIPAAQTHAVTLTSTSLIPSTSGGLSLTHKANSAATTNATSVKNAAGTLAMLIASNMSASWRYLKFFNKASAPTVGTDTPIMTIPLQPNSTMAMPMAIAMRFATGIAYAITAGLADSDATAIGANEVVINLLYV